MNEGNITTDSVDATSCSYTIVGAVFTILPVVCIILVIIFGNGLVIIAVVKCPTIRILKQNWLICSLALSDFLVGLLIMPLTLTYEILGRWVLGPVLCEIWLALDVLFVTASILHLCAISLDRYWSLTNPINYPRQRTKRKVLGMICISWFIALAICLPPLIAPHSDRANQCGLSTDKGYVLYSAFGSFGVPVVILIVVYIRIFQINKNWMEKKMREASKKARSLSMLPPGLNTLDSTPTEKKLKSTEEESKMYFPLSPKILRSPPAIPKTVIEIQEPAEDEEDDETTKETNFSKTTKSSFRSKRGSSTSKDEVCSNHSLSPPAPRLDMSPRSSFLLAVSKHCEKPKRSSFPAIALTSMNLSRKFSAHSTDPSKQRKSDDSVQGLNLESQRLINHLQERRRELKRKDRQATLILGVVMVSFVACWTPFFLVYVLGAFDVHVPELVFDIFFWIGYCNSAFNPVIYTVFNREFRTAFYKILYRK